MKKNKYPEVIIELANTHGGSIKSLKSIISQASEVKYERKSIKFQIFSPDGIAVEEYDWYETYKKITFNAKEWSSILTFSHKKFNRIWVDIFDDFGLKVIEKNQRYIYGIKLQASTLDNHRLIANLATIKLNKIKLMINISGISLKKIDAILKKFKKLNCQEVILQFGFQNYPTTISDTALQKISTLKKHFYEQICVADHSDANEEISKDIPIYALALGANLVEKHFCISRAKAPYDSFSSLELDEFNTMTSKIKQFIESSNGKFIPTNESKYLKDSIQKPIICAQVKDGEMISFDKLLYKRTNENGLNIQQIRDYQEKFYIFKESKFENQTIKKRSLRKARIGIICAGRMKSSRLKKKAILKIFGTESISLCLSSCKKIKNISKVILATSTTNEDSILNNYLPKGVDIFYGDPDNVIKRYIDAAEKFNLDVVIRVTADCPFISSEIAEILLKSHFNRGADYTAAKNFSVGTSCEIINLSALQKVANYFPDAEYSEYMTWYFKNNADHFDLNIVDLPADLIRDYRMTLDYKEDLVMFTKLFRKLDKDPVNIKNIFSILDKNPAISDINQAIPLKYKSNKNLIRTLNKMTKITK